MNKALREYLESLTLRSESTTQDAWKFYNNLTGDQLTQARALKDGKTPATQTDPAADPMKLALRQYLETLTLRSDATDQDAWKYLGALTGDNLAHATALKEGKDPIAAPPLDELTIRQQAATAERARIDEIHQLAGDDVPSELTTRAIQENWTPERASRQFLQAIRDGRSTPANSGPALHTRSHEGDCSLPALQAAMILRQGGVLDHESYTTRQAVAMGLPDWLRRDINDETRQQTMEQAHRYSAISLVDVCREAVRMDGGTVSYDNELTIRAAISGGSLTAIFSTNVNAELLGAYVDADDTTRGWAAETDVVNFLATERAAMGKFGGLTPHAKGSEADHLDVDDSKESSKIARYTGQFILDEMDIINDRFGALGTLSPADIGNSAAQLRPDLLYSLLLANAALDADGVALFHASHNNIDTNAFNPTNLQAGITTMGKQRIRKRALNVKPRFLLIPKDLEWVADIDLTSAERRQASASGGGTKNPLLGRGISIVSDDRLGAAGVTDPLTGTTYTGSATLWMLAARAGENGAKTVVVKYRRGTGRAPTIRSFQLTQGQWGIGWDIKHDIGVDADDFRGFYKGNS